MHETLPSCEEWKVKLTIRDDNDACSDCLNWNFLNGKHSSKCIDSNGRSATHPQKLSLKSQ